MPVLPTTESVGEARRRHSRELADVSSTPQLDVDLMLGHVLGYPRLKLISEYNAPLTLEQSEQLADFVARRRVGEPVAYITGRKMFRNIELFVDHRVLVPRSETEQMVDIAIERIRSVRGFLRVIDIGTGSGAIALSLADETRAIAEQLEIIATDVSPQAIEVATANRCKLDLNDRVQLRPTSLLEGVELEFDIILANLPYLRPDQEHWSTRLEPESALFGGEDGFDLYRELFRQLPGRLTAQGIVVAEIDPAQVSSSIEELREIAGLDGRIVFDLFGRERFLIGEYQ